MFILGFVCPERRIQLVGMKQSEDLMQIFMTGEKTDDTGTSNLENR